jgi:hypothetical protein
VVLTNRRAGVPGQSGEVQRLRQVGLACSGLRG